MAVRPAGAELEFSAATTPVRDASWPATVVRFARRKPLGALGGVLLLVMALTALFAQEP